MIERFELRLNGNGQADIVDWFESEQKDAICIYNDLGVLPYSSAKAVCDILNAFHEENQKMKQKGLKVLEFYINKLKNTNNDIQSVRDEIWIVKQVLYEMGVLDE